MPRRADLARTAVIVGAAALLVGSVRAKVAGWHERVKETSDVHMLPPPRQVVTLSLGYRAALADVLWAHVLVAQGERLRERRKFDNLAELIETINELDPEFREPYMLADALIMLQVTAAGPEEARRTRAILERGLENRPLDAELWRTAGQFVTFIGAGVLNDDPATADAWRADGARMLARAAELGADQGFAGWSALAGAGILSQKGERDAAIRLLQRQLAVTEDPELRERLERQLAKHVGEAKKDAYLRRQRELIETGRRALPFVSRIEIDVLGPPFDPAYCAGGVHADDRRCALTWKEWTALTEGQGAPSP